ncbi:DUF2199 domain-containing protein [Massilia antarctica]|uniref:DUF2199 domain-containing protein n=1 Tax=Massilia antarctica TaxID=2765360 RepID=UPI0006BB67D7|nr:DUF2199 domain-containing protein [Massilia sp. H27-R4]MCY0912217.1 DUF2199 domain-containing protein [Massilia sp. H27-R4]CUI06291.1 hypothetical protein BN2497_7359 [Janthinobacterium sp. CG23_2]CUU30077.1 hypothetical protein BN3177_7359 [Janthinobacterium sp. CG23_2]
MFSFKCSSCNEIHEGMPSYAAHAPLSYDRIPEAERDARCELGSDDCVIDASMFLVRGCIEIPVVGEAEPFVWGVWVSLSEASYREWVKCFDLDQRSHIGPFFGWLNTSLSPYPATPSLKTMVHIRDGNLRPYIELEQTDHPLSVEQREGITRERLAQIYTFMMHGQ